MVFLAVYKERGSCGRAALGSGAALALGRRWLLLGRVTKVSLEWAGLVTGVSPLAAGGRLWQSSA